MRSLTLYFSVLALAFCAHSAHAFALRPDVDRAVAFALEKHLDTNPQWLKLVHYQKTLFGGYVSDAVNQTFFVDPKGRKDPRAELEATLRIGFSGEPLPPAMPEAPAMPVRCQFPARWKFLMRELSSLNLKLDAIDCPVYEKFLRQMDTRSVTFVFSGYYVNNPSSIFGHVFLRLNSGGRKGFAGAELLDYGVGYAADQTGANKFLDAFYGLAGMSPGSFSAVKYYSKVREYSDAESRDLWEYDLNLTPAEVETLTDHVWELGSATFNYYYFTKNCAYHLLYLLEIAAPRLHLIDRMPFYEIPSDGVKAVAIEPGLVGAVHYRPSTQKILGERFRQLKPDEKTEFLKVRKDPAPEKAVKDLDPEAQAKVLDTVLDDLDYRFYNELIRQENDAETVRKQRILLARAKLPPGDDIIIPYTDADRPDKGHSSGRFSLGVGTQSDPTLNSSLIDAEVRFALHDISDPLQGYLHYSTVEFWRMQGRAFPSISRFDLQSFSLITVSSIAPMSVLEHNFSWRFDLGAERVRDRRCDDCLAADLSVLYGASAQPVRGLVTYALLGGIGEAATTFGGDHWTPGLSAHVGFRLKPTDWIELIGDGEWRRVFDIETFDRLSSSLKLRSDFGQPDRSPFAIEAALTNEVGSNDAILRVLKYF